MSAYLRSWLTGVPTQTPTQPEGDKEEQQEAHSDLSISVVPPKHSKEADEKDDSDADSDATDTPPAFPALNSAQRMSTPQNASSSSASSSSVLPRALTDTALMPPPPLPASALRVPGVPSLSSRNRTSGLNLKPPPTLSVSGSGSSSGSLLPPPTTSKAPAKKAREKVALAPGYGPLDWAALKSSGTDLRGVDTLLRVPPSILKEHGKEAQEVWTVINNKVYNITHYLPYHPGGEKELMRVAGRDGTRLFQQTHAWVNAEFMLDQCLVGFYISNGS